MFYCVFNGEGDEVDNKTNEKDHTWIKCNFT